jgi:Bacterial regulatory proteins, luxR family
VLDEAMHGEEQPGLTVLTARELHVSVHAIKFHLAAIYSRLGVTNRTEAAVRYLRLTNGSLGTEPQGD